MNAGGIQAPDFLRDQSATQDCRQAQLIASGNKDASRIVELLNVFRAVGVGALGNGQRNRISDPDLGENLDVAIAGVGEIGCSGYDDQSCLPATTKFYETLQYPHRTGAFFGATDGYNIAAYLIGMLWGWTHK